MEAVFVKALLLCLGFGFLTCCSSMCTPSRSDLTPEQVVELYLDTSINMTDPGQKSILLDLTTGILHSSINSADEEVLAAAFIKKRYELESYSVIERRDRTPLETEITFEIVYFDKSDGAKDAPKTITENTVALTREDGIWRIRDVIGKRTSIEFFVADEVVKPAPAGAESPQQ